MSIIYCWRHGKLTPAWYGAACCASSSTTRENNYCVRLTTSSEQNNRAERYVLPLKVMFAAKVSNCQLQHAYFRRPVQISRSGRTAQPFLGCVLNFVHVFALCVEACMLLLFIKKLFHVVCGGDANARLERNTASQA